MKEKVFYKQGNFKQILKDWEDGNGCMATDRIMVDGCKVGYMYREKPDDDTQFGKVDSGWRFFAGDESDEYANNADNVGIYTLNTLCNYDEDIVPFLNAPYNSAFARDENGNFIKEDFEAMEEFRE